MPLLLQYVAGDFNCPTKVSTRISNGQCRSGPPFAEPGNKLIGGLRSEAPTGFQSRHGRSRESTPSPVSLLLSRHTSRRPRGSRGDVQDALSTIFFQFGLRGGWRAHTRGSDISTRPRPIEDSPPKRYSTSRFLPSTLRGSRSCVFWGLDQLRHSGGRQIAEPIEF